MPSLLFSKANISSVSDQPNDISKLQCGHSVNIAPRTIQICALFKPIFSFRLSISGDVISKKCTHDMSCVELCDHIMSEWNQNARSLLWRGQPNVAPSVHIEFFPGCQHLSMLFWRIYLGESLWCIVSVTHCSFPFLLICCCLLSFSVAMLEELGQNGNDIKLLLQIVGCSIIKYFAQFVGFDISPNVPCCCILFL